MEDTQEYSSREWQRIVDRSAIDRFIVDVLSKEFSTVKGFEESKPKAKFLSKKPDGTYVLKLDSPLAFPEQKGTVYANLEKHSELDFEIIQSKEDLYLVKPTVLRIAEQERKSARIFDVRGKISAGNFLVSKENIDEAKIFGVASSVLIQDIHKRLIPLNYSSEVIMAAQTSLTEEMELAFKREKIVYILDAYRMVSSTDPKVLDIRKEYENELVLDDKIVEFNKQKIASLIIYPIIIPFGPKKPFAFLVCKKDSGGIEHQLLELYKEVEKTFLNRIMDSNTHTIDVKQNVVNASLHGVALEITDPRIRKALQVKPSLTVDLNFKMQQPLRVALDVRYIQVHKDYDIVGTEIAGFSGDMEGAQRYKMFLEFIQKL